jgi:hypothetical protein
MRIGWFYDRDVKAAFGLAEKAKWPAEGMTKRVVLLGGFSITAWIDPIRVRNNTRRPRFGLRAMCSCPVCGQIMPLGRVRQHAKFHEGQNHG